PEGTPRGSSRGAAGDLRADHRGGARRRRLGRGPRGGRRRPRLPDHRRPEGARRRGHPGDAHREADAVSAGETTGVALFRRGRLDALDGPGLRHLLEREPAGADEVRDVVAALVRSVRLEGDGALHAMAERFDGVSLDALEVPRGAWDRALDRLPPGVRTALERAARNSRAFHAAPIPDEVRAEVEPGVRLTRVWTPLARAGVYAPGGTAAYPSSILMGVVPARAAGVGEVVVCSPPGPSGAPPDTVLAACALAGADRLFAVGGAGAVAALAYGTASVPRVDVIVGPGNRWVTEAKRQVAGDVAIDAPA